MASATGDDSFTLVTRKRGRRPLKSTHNPDGAAEAQPLAEGPKTVASDDSPDPATIIRRLIEPECELVRAGYVEQVVTALMTIPVVASGQPMRLVGYGLGSFCSGAVSRLQYSCFRGLARRLSLSDAPELFDPVMTAAEVAVAKEHGIRVPDTNEVAKRRCAGEATVFFMPHCGIELYNNLLWANWEASNLPSVIVVGNSFEFYAENAVGASLEKRARYLASACGFVTEVSLQNTVNPQSAFNNTSVHHFATDGIGRLPPSMWADAAEPSYDSGGEAVS